MPGGTPRRLRRRRVRSAAMGEQAAAGVRVNVYGRGEATVETGLPVLNRLLTRLAETARFDVVLDIEPGDTEAEVEAAAAALGHALAGLRRRIDDVGRGACRRRARDERRAALRHERRPDTGSHRRARHRRHTAL